MLPIHATFYICSAFVHEIPLVSMSKRNVRLGTKSRTPEKPL